MQYRKLTKIEIAERQLFKAIELYLADQDLVSVITLAGAAEEILGQLVRRRGGKSALDEKVTVLCGLFEAVFKTPANRKEFVDLRNEARNELKHIGKSDHIELDLEQEAVKLLARAIDNYKKLGQGQTTSKTKIFYNFRKERSRRYRQHALSA